MYFLYPLENSGDQPCGEQLKSALALRSANLSTMQKAVVSAASRIYPRRSRLRQTVLNFESQRPLNSTSQRRMQRAFSDLLISLPGGRTLPPPLAHVFRFHVVQSDPVLVVQFITKMSFGGGESAFGFSKQLGSFRFARVRQ